MKLITLFAAATAMVTSALSLAIRDDNHPNLDVNLSQIGNSLVKAVITNPNSEPLTLLNHHFFNSFAPTKKVSVYRDGSELHFHGVHLRYKTSDLGPESFTTLMPGESFEDIIDIAATTDVSEGGSVIVNSKGAVRYLDDDGVTLRGPIHYESNDLEMNIDGSEAAHVKRATDLLQQRTALRECNETYRRELEFALEDTARMAALAAEGARGNTAKVAEYFKEDHDWLIDQVAGHFLAVASEAKRDGGSETVYYCLGAPDLCIHPSVLAYSITDENLIANCESYYELPGISNHLETLDRVTTTLHEFTHLPAIFVTESGEYGTDDFAYGYEECMLLTMEEALENADTYAFFAKDIYLGLR